MYAITIIRINNDSRIFENTESHRITSLQDVEQELINMGAEFSSFDKVCEMNVGESKTIQFTIYNGIKKCRRFMYIHKIK